MQIEDQTTVDHLPRYSIGMDGYMESDEDGQWVPLADALAMRSKVLMTYFETEEAFLNSKYPISCVAAFKAGIRAGEQHILNSTSKLEGT